MRKAEAKIGLLREVVERVQRGEEVDVEGVLGTGEEGREGEWAESKFSYVSERRVMADLRQY